MYANATKTTCRHIFVKSAVLKVSTQRGLSLQYDLVEADFQSEIFSKHAQEESEHSVVIMIMVILQEDLLKACLNKRSLQINLVHSGANTMSGQVSWCKVSFRRGTLGYFHKVGQFARF